MVVTTDVVVVVSGTVVVVAGSVVVVGGTVVVVVGGTVVVVVGGTVVVVVGGTVVVVVVGGRVVVVVGGVLVVTVVVVGVVVTVTTTGAEAATGTAAVAWGKMAGCKREAMLGSVTLVVVTFLPFSEARPVRKAENDSRKGIGSPGDAGAVVVVVVGARLSDWRPAAELRWWSSMRRETPCSCDGWPAAPYRQDP